MHTFTYLFPVFFENHPKQENDNRDNRESCRKKRDGRTNICHRHTGLKPFDINWTWLPGLKIHTESQGEWKNHNKQDQEQNRNYFAFHFTFLS
jgi:hypothetical protein